jgi:IS6 family transposase
MFCVPSISGLFKWRQFEPEVILLAVGWYLRFSLSYRDVEELLAERGLHADHVTVWRWVQRYAPEMERRLRRHLKPTNETYIRVKGKWRYLYRAVDSSGATPQRRARGDAVAGFRVLQLLPGVGPASARNVLARLSEYHFLFKALNGVSIPPATRAAALT